MSRDLHQVVGLILSGQPLGESNRLFLIFTRELGLIKATAQSVRESKSKLRAYLQVGRVVKLDLVRGREFWRITGVVASENFFPAYGPGREALSRVIKLIIRMLPPEEPNVELYDDLASASELLAVTENLVATETLLVLRVLHSLGYFDSSPEFDNFTVDQSLTPALVQQFLPVRRSATKLINDALAESHL